MIPIDRGEPDMPIDDGADLDAMLVRNLISPDVEKELEVDRSGAKHRQALEDLGVIRKSGAVEFQEPRPLDQRWPDAAIALVGLVGLAGLIAAMLGFLATGAICVALAVGLSRYGNRRETNWGFTYAVLLALAFSMTFGAGHNSRQTIEAQGIEGWRWAKDHGVTEVGQCVGPAVFVAGCEEWADQN